MCVGVLGTTSGAGAFMKSPAGASCADIVCAAGAIMITPNYYGGSPPADCGSATDLSMAGYCTQCPTGSYTPGGTATACVTCVNGWTPTVGSSKTMQCICNAGSYRTTDLTPNCTLCPPNHFCPGGETQPQLCPSNPPTHYSYTGAASNSSCICDAGYFYGSGSTYTCGECPPGQFCPTESKWGTQCPGNTTSDPLSTSILACSCLPGYKPVSPAASGTTGVNCTACSTYEYCLSGSIQVCPPNSFVAAGKTGNKITDCVCSGGWYSTFGPGGQL